MAQPMNRNGSFCLCANARCMDGIHTNASHYGYYYAQRLRLQSLLLLLLELDLSWNFNLCCRQHGAFAYFVLYGDRPGVKLEKKGFPPRPIPFYSKLNRSDSIRYGAENDGYSWRMYFARLTISRMRHRIRLFLSVQLFWIVRSKLG